MVPVEREEGKREREKKRERERERGEGNQFIEYREQQYTHTQKHTHLTYMVSHNQVHTSLWSTYNVMCCTEVVQVLQCTCMSMHKYMNSCVLPMYTYNRYIILLLHCNY